jgi:hypothetical protein
MLVLSGITFSNFYKIQKVANFVSQNQLTVTLHLREIIKKIIQNSEENQTTIKPITFKCQLLKIIKIIKNEVAD